MSRISLQTYVENYIELDAGTPSSHINKFNMTANNTVTTDATGITLSYLNGGYVYYPYVFSIDENWEFTVEIGAKTSGSQHPYIAMAILDSNTLIQRDYIIMWSNSLLSYYPSKWPEDSSELQYRTSFNVGDKLTVKRENGTTYVYLNNVLRLSHTHQYDGNIFLGYSLNNSTGGAMTIKNIKIKRL